MAKFYRENGGSFLRIAIWLTAVCLICFLSGCQASEIGDELKDNAVSKIDNVISDISSGISDVLNGDDKSGGEGGRRHFNDDGDERGNSGSDGDGSYHFGDNISLRSVSDFSEGLAWIEFSELDIDDGTYQTMIDGFNVAMGNDVDKILYALENYNAEGYYRGGLIDTDGRLIWQTPRAKNDVVFLEYSDFTDGLGCCLMQSNDGPLWLAVNNKGELIFARNGDSNFTILGVGGGYVLMAEYVADFNTNSWKIGAIDASGEIVSPFTTYMELPPKGPEPVSAPAGDPPDPNYDYWGYLDYMAQLQAFENYQNYEYEVEPVDCDKLSLSNTEYLGDGIFKLSRDGGFGGFNLINIRTQQVIYTENIYRHDQSGSILAFLSDFENGTADILYDDEVTEVAFGDYTLAGQLTISSIDTNGNITIGESNEWIQRELQGNTDYFFDGLAFCSDGYYRDYYGNEVVSVPEYRGIRQYIGDYFVNGHAAVLVDGADGRWYLTAIDKNGQVLFEPKPGFDSAFISNDGEYIGAVQDGILTVFDISGKTLLEVHYWPIGGNRLSYQTFSINDKVLKVLGFYVNVETKAVIGMPHEIDRDFEIITY